jgi:hypothetical protein
MSYTFGHRFRAPLARRPRTAPSSPAFPSYTPSGIGLQATGCARQAGPARPRTARRLVQLNGYPRDQISYQGDYYTVDQARSVVDAMNTFCDWAEATLD